MELYIAEWYSTWGEYTGIVGIFDTHDKAEAALKEHVPLCWKANDGIAGTEVTKVILNEIYDA